MSKKIKIILIITLVAAAAAGYFVYLNNNQPPPAIRTTGMVEAVETSIAAKISGRLTAVNFREGESVSDGDVIATLDPAEYEAALNKAEAELAAAKSALNNGYDTVQNAKARLAAAEADTRRADAQVDSAAAQLSQTDKDLARANELFDKGVISNSELDLADTAHATASAELEASKAARVSAGSLADAAKAALTEAGGRIDTLKAQVAVAQSAVELARTKLADTVITSPTDAVVEYRTLEPGEVVAPGTSILTLTDPASTWVRIDLDERNINSVKAGDKASVRLEYMPDKVIDAEVFDIGREGEFAVERDVTRGRQDIRTFRTRVWVDDPDGILKPGMTVIVEIPLH